MLSLLVNGQYLQKSSDLSTYEYLAKVVIQVINNVLQIIDYFIINNQFLISVLCACNI